MRAVVLAVIESLLVSQLREAATEAPGQVRNTEERVLPPLEAVTRRLIAEVTEDTSVCVTVI
jgi:hypothetical protein